MIRILIAGLIVGGSVMDVAAKTKKEQAGAPASRMSWDDCIRKQGLNPDDVRFKPHVYQAQTEICARR